jgi:predicted transcriptional regulator of viral defense system/very-short-patch-repair endonuclease
MTAAHEGLNRLTRRQHGLVSAPQAGALGLTDRHVEDRVRRGHWTAVRRGVYALAGMAPTREQALLAAVLAAGGGAAVSHRSAGHLWGMRGVEDPERIDLVTDLRGRPRLDGVTAHRSGAIFDEDVTRVRGVPVTSRARTLVDLSGCLCFSQLRAALDDSLRHGLSLDALRRCAGRLGSAPGRRMRIVHELLADRLPGYDPGDSDLETRVLRVLVGAGLPVPRQQVPVKVGGRRFKLDLAYPDVRVGIELDGWETHGNFTAFHGDRERDALLASAGWVVTHFSARTHDQEMVAAVTGLRARFGQPAEA